MANQAITLSFVHPTDSEKVLTAEVSTSSTPTYLVGQMIQAGWLNAPGTAGQYKLREAQSGKQLLDNMPIASAGVAEGATLAIDHSTAGAFGVRTAAA